MSSYVIVYASSQATPMQIFLHSCEIKIWEWPGDEATVATPCSAREGRVLVTSFYSEDLGKFRVYWT